MLFSKDITYDLKRNKFIVATLCIGMFPIWAGGYCGYLLFLLFPLIFKSKFDKTSGLILVFSVLYTYSMMRQPGGLTPSAIIFYLAFPLIMYQSGKYIGSRFKSPRSGIYLLVTMAICMALPAILLNLQDIATTGQLVNPLRSVAFNADGDVRSATGYGMMVSLMCGCAGCLLISSKGNMADKQLKILLILGIVGALLTTFHLVNRTGIVLAIASILVMIILPPYSTKKILYIMLTAILLTLLYIFVLRDYFDVAEIVESYSDRNEGVGSVSSAGGRNERWAAGLSQILTEPMGNPQGIHWEGSYNYAHNLVIDGGVKGGFICFVILLVLVISLVKKIIKFCKQACSVTPFEKMTVVFIGVTLFLQCMVEPVIDALPQYFWYFLFFIGLIPYTTAKRIY